MSQIDQAFIQAYAQERQPVEQPGAQMQPESIPAPHFPIQGQPIERKPIYQQPAEPAASVAMPASQPVIEPPVVEDSMPAASVPPEPIAPPAPSAAPTSERLPLSSFTTPQPAATEVFSPVFEVDTFRWPTIVDEMLQTHGQLLVPIAEQLLDASGHGRVMVGIAGAAAEVGTTTLHLCLSRLMASAGRQVMLVDGDFVNRSMVRQLGLDFDVGWEHVLAGEIPLAESVIRSTEENMALLPLVGHRTAVGDLLSGIQAAVSAGVLRHHYDVVMVDLGAASSRPQWDTARRIVEHCRIDTSLIVAESNEANSDSAQHIELLTSLLGKTCLGTIFNQAS